MVRHTSRNSDSVLWPNDSSLQPDPRDFPSYPPDRFFTRSSLRSAPQAYRTFLRARSKPRPQLRSLLASSRTLLLSADHCLEVRLNFTVLGYFLLDPGFGALDVGSGVSELSGGGCGGLLGSRNIFFAGVRVGGILLSRERCHQSLEWACWRKGWLSWR